MCGRVDGEGPINTSQLTEFWPLVGYSFFILFLVGGILVVSHVLGQRHKDKAKGEVYESGIVATGNTHVRFSAHFYLVALFFLIFDLEAIFLFAWAVAAREIGWAGFYGVLFFIVILTVILAYEWKIGALNWGPDKRVTEKEA